MKDVIGNLADIMKEKFPRRKILSILNLLDTPAEAQQLLDWMKQQDIEELEEPDILKKIHEIQKN